ncbi:glycoside hydrolase family 130 protein [soil metagenome]
MPFPHRTIAVERLFDGQPILSPLGTGWESGVTFNASAILVTPNHETAYAALLGEGGAEKHPNGIVAIHYRARPKEDPGFQHTRSFIGLAVYTPELELIRRYPEPVLSPSEDEDDFDYLGCEDPRVTYLDGWYWMVYCGVRKITADDPDKTWLATACIAKSRDLLTWDRIGAIIGYGDAFAADATEPEDPDGRVGNKDGVLMPDRIGGKVYLLHRPMRGDNHEFRTALALSDRPEGPYLDLGFVNGALIMSDQYVSSWTGAGGVPIPLGDERYLSIAHTGNYLENYKREYVLDAHLYDFKHLNPLKPSCILRARMDSFMGPETDFEVHGPFPDSVANVVFACGNYLYNGWVYIVYGGGDSFTLAARVRLEDLVKELEKREKETFNEEC